MPNQPIHIRNTVKAVHLLLTGYAHWLPNDPRGAGSTEIRKLGLRPLGPIHLGRKRQQPDRRELRAFYCEAEPLLQYSTIWFDRQARDTLDRAFASVIQDRGYACYACAILRNHVHFVIRTHRDSSLLMLTHLAFASQIALRDAGIVSCDHRVWAERPYKVFLRTASDVQVRIRYVEGNPEKEGLAPQRYDWVVPSLLR